VGRGYVIIYYTKTKYTHTHTHFAHMYILHTCWGEKYAISRAFMYTLRYYITRIRTHTHIFTHTHLHIMYILYMHVIGGREKTCVYEYSHTDTSWAIIYSAAFAKTALYLPRFCRPSPEGRWESSPLPRLHRSPPPPPLSIFLSVVVVVVVVIAVVTAALCIIIIS